MRWPSVAIFAYLMLGLHQGAAKAMEWHYAQPDFVLIGVVYLALVAPRGAALLGAFAMGLGQDLLSVGPPGLGAVIAGLAALFVLSLQSIVQREHPVTHFIAALGAGLIAAVVTLIQMKLDWMLHRPPELADQPLQGVHAGALFLSALYTAALAPVVLGVVQRLARAAGIRPAPRAAY